MLDRLFKAAEVAEILKVSQMTIIRRCRDGSLPFVQVGKLRRIREVDLEYFILSESGKLKKKQQQPKPIYDGPPAEECGFEDDIDAWQQEMDELCAKANEIIKAKKSSV